MSKCENGVCPVVAAIREIRGAGLDDIDGDGGRTVIIGGHARVVDEVAFYMMTAKLELARFELSAPGPAAIARFATSHQWTTPTDTRAVYERVIRQTVGRSGLVEQLDAVETMLFQLAELVMTRVDQLSAEGKPIDVSIPGHMPAITPDVLYRPDLLAEVVRGLITWVDHLSIDSIIQRPPRPDGIGLSIPLTPPSPPEPKKINAVGKSSPATMADLRARHNAEMEVCELVRGVETFHCSVITALEHIIERISISAS